MTGTKSYYSILEIPENASREEIQASYRRLAKKYHPDVNKSPDAHEKFCLITEAYEFVMDHWSVPQSQPVSAPETDFVEKYRQEVRERAKKQAKMRYEKFKQQHEAFQESGLNDVALLLKIGLRIFGFLFFLFLAFLPFYVALRFGWISVLILFFTWPFAGIIGWYMYDNRQNYFVPGRLYYSPERIWHMFKDVHPSLEKCFYCPSRIANSIPFKIELFKLKDIKMATGGFRQHQVNYQNKHIVLSVPRSQKAFIIHNACTVIKIVSLLSGLFFFPVSSIIWRFIAGLVAGGLITLLLLLITGTRARSGYIISTGLIIRMIVWIASISLVSRFYLHPFNITTSDAIQFVVTAIVIFDCLVMQLLDMIPGNFSLKTPARQPAALQSCMQAGYHIYNDIPVISVIYPLFKWFAG
jgi:hypothetical protein